MSSDSRASNNPETPASGPLTAESRRSHDTIRTIVSRGHAARPSRGAWSLSTFRAGTDSADTSGHAARRGRTRPDTAPP